MIIENYRYNDLYFFEYRKLLIVTWFDMYTLLDLDFSTILGTI